MVVKKAIITIPGVHFIMYSLVYNIAIIKLSITTWKHIDLICHRDGNGKFRPDALDNALRDLDRVMMLTEGMNDDDDDDDKGVVGITICNSIYK